MQLPVFDMGRSDSPENIEVSESIFNRDYNESLVHQVLVAYQANARQATRAQKTRAEVRGGGRKPWRQKGTGRARAGSIRSPIWVGGGRAHPARPEQNFSQKVNKKMYHGAICSILSELIRQNRLTVVDSLSVEQPKTKALLAILNGANLMIEKDLLIVVDEVTDNLILASNNLYNVGLLEAHQIDPFSLIGFSHTVISRSALKLLEDRLQ